MTSRERTSFRREAARSAMQAIVSNPAAWAQLKTECDINGLPHGEGLAIAACNFADALATERERRESGKPQAVQS